jgi:hypothetical protein
MAETTINFSYDINVIETRDELNNERQYRFSFALVFWSILTITIHYVIKIASAEIVLLLAAIWMISNAALSVYSLILLAEMYPEYKHVLFCYS